MKTIINTNSAPAPIGSYNQAVLVGNMLFTSGQIAIHPANGELVNETIEAETTQVMNNLLAVLKEANCTFNNVVKTTIFLTDLKQFSSVNNIYGSYFDEATAPARETVQVAKLPKNVHIEISLIAVKS